MPIFFSSKGSTVLIKIMTKKLGSLYSFLRWSCRKCAPNAFSPIFERGLGRVSKLNVCHRGKEVLKNPFFQNLHRDITFRTRCDKESTSLKIKVSKHKLNIHYQLLSRFFVRKSNSATRVLLTLCTFPTH